jgi:ATP-dependent RNA helicase RhlE
MYTRPAIVRPQRKIILTIEQFESMGLAPAILNSLKELGYKEPTPIQKEAIPLVLEGHDIMGLAQTGTGKTAAFGLPLVQQLMGIGSRPHPKTVRALILSPTRELTNQIAENLRSFVRNTHLRVVTVVGGQSINVQQRNLGKGNDILVATPGRLLDLVNRKAVLLESAKFLVLDEADQMLDLGFIHDLKKISKLVAKERQTLLFSATMPKEIADLAKAFLKDPIRIQVSPSGKAADKVTQSVHYVAQRAKADLLKTLLAKRPDDLSLVFARTKHGAEKLMKGLVAEGFPAGSIHGNKSQGQRDRAIAAFKSGEIRILVATDVAARGIDISGVSHVYNFDLPEVPANYVHRIGRTARAGADGLAVAFCAPEEAHLLKAIENLMGQRVEVVGGSMSEEERIEGARLALENRRGKGRGGRPQSANSPKGKSGGGKGNGAGRRGGKGSASSGAPNNGQAPAMNADSGNDDFAKVRDAGFTGKPNSKKNRKRFGRNGEGTDKPIAASVIGKGSNRNGKGAGDPEGTGNRHAPQFRSRSDAADGSSRGEPARNHPVKPKGAGRNNRHGADRAANAAPGGGRESLGTSQRRPAGKSAGWQGRKKSRTA